MSGRLFPCKMRAFFFFFSFEPQQEVETPERSNGDHSAVTPGSLSRPHPDPTQVSSITATRLSAGTNVHILFKYVDSTLHPHSLLVVTGTSKCGAPDDDTTGCSGVSHRQSCDWSVIHSEERAMHQKSFL